MSNKLTASIVFSFKGQTHNPSIELDLDKFMAREKQLPDLYPLIARENGFDLYSYEYEIMQAEDITFSQASGLVADFIDDGKLDIHGFEQAWQQQQSLDKLQQIAREQLDIDDLQQHPELQKALLAAFHYGQSQASA